MIHESAAVDGPVSYGEGVSIGANCRISGPVVLGDGVVVEESARIQDSVILADSRIGANAILKGAIVAQGVVVPAGTGVASGGVFDGEAVLATDGAV